MSHSLTLTDASRSAFIASLADPAVAAAVLADLAATTGNVAFKKAAAFIAARPGGRPACQDEGLLNRMTALLDSGVARSASQAARYVAATIPGRSAGSTAVRLATKYLRRQNKKTI
jgi:hypothetical protein